MPHLCLCQNLILAIIYQCEDSPGAPVRPRSPGRLALEEFHYLHATRGELLRRLGRADEAREAYGRALALVHEDAERRLLERRLVELTR